MKVSVLGVEYEIVHCGQHADQNLRDADGYCDTSIKKIVVDNMRESEGDVGVKEDLKGHAKKVLRHELVHAFLSESGLNECSWGHDEECVDWIAWQFPKMLAVFKEAKAI